MTDTKRRRRKRRDRKRREHLAEWTDTPAANPLYQGATPREVARALLGKSRVQQG